MTAWAMIAPLLLAQSALEIYQRAVTLLERRDLEGAQTAVEEALGLDPNLTPALLLKTKLAINSGRLDQAQHAAQSVLAAEPSHRQARFLLGMVFYLENDLEKARATLASADSNDARVVFYRALTEEALNQTDTARQHYERALKLDPSAAEPKVAYARLFFGAGELDRAEALVDEALRLAPRSAEALYEKGRCRLER